MNRFLLFALSLSLAACTPISYSVNPRETKLSIAESLANPRDSRAFPGLEPESRSRLQSVTLTLGSILHSLSNEIDQLEFRPAPIMPTAASPERGAIPTSAEYLDQWAVASAFELDPTKVHELWVHVVFKDGSELQLVATHLRTDGDFNDATAQTLLQKNVKRVVNMATSFQKFPLLNAQGTLEVLALSEAASGGWIQVLRSTQPADQVSDLFETSVVQHGYVLENKVFYGVAHP